LKACEQNLKHFLAFCLSQKIHSLTDPRTVRSNSSSDGDDAPQLATAVAEGGSAAAAESTAGHRGGKGAKRDMRDAANVYPYISEYVMRFLMKFSSSLI